jgi:outer membrane protein insertion porin family
MAAWQLWLLLCTAQDGLAEELAHGRIVRDIRIEGLKRTRRETVLRQMSAKVGEPYRAGTAAHDRELLDRLTIFSAIEVIPRAEGDEVAIDVHVTEIFPYTVYPSISSTQENGLSIGPAAGAVNGLGRGIKGSLSTEFGGATNVGLRIRTPIRTQRPWWHEVGYSRGVRDNTLFEFPERAQSGDFLAGYQFNENLRVLARLTVLSIGTSQPAITLNPSGRDVIPTVGFGVQYDTRNLWTNATTGWFAQVNTGRSGVFGGDGGWWTHTAEVLRYQPISGRNTLAFFTLASLQSGRVGRDLPVYMQYGIGGRNAIRGWNQNARIGKSQWLNTVEYRYELVKVRPTRIFGFNVFWGIQLAAFGDLGTAWNEGDEFTRNFIGSGGYGVRLVIPYVGMIRFDRAFGDAFRPAWAIGDRVDYWRGRVR